MVCKWRLGLSLLVVGALCATPASAYTIYAGISLAIHQDIPDGSLPGGRLPNDFHIEGLICTKNGVPPVLHDSRNDLFQTFTHNLVKLNPDPADCWYYFSADWTNPIGNGIPYCTVLHLGLLFYIQDENTMIDLMGWWTLDGIRVGDIMGYYNNGYQPLTGFSVGTNAQGQPVARVGDGFVPPIIGPTPWPPPSPWPMPLNITELDVLSIPGRNLPSNWFNELYEGGAQQTWPWVPVLNAQGNDINPGNPLHMMPDSFFDVFLEMSGTGQIHPATPIQVPEGNMLFVRSRRMFTNNAGIPDPNNGLWEWHIHEAQTNPEACCFPDGRCEMRTPADCVQVGGFPMGAGTTCLPNNPCPQPNLGACCYGTVAIMCVVTDRITCEQQYQGQFKGVGTNCDDLDGDGTADICEEPTAPQACCLNGTCQMLDPATCVQLAGVPKGPGSRCLGDLNGNGVDDLCEAKWYQMPDLETTGTDVKATFPNVLADDFLCNQRTLITDITVWGSWLNDILPGGPQNVQFTLSIHADIPDPDGQGPAYSMPGPVLWHRVFPPGTFLVEPFQTNINEGWWNPFVPGSYIFPGDHICWQYYFPVPPAEAFCQEGSPQLPIVYWLDVQAQPLGAPSEAYFGWKTSLNHWNDDAVAGQGQEPYPGPWMELRYPPQHPLYPQSLDLAFALGGDQPCPPKTEACCLPDGTCVDVDPLTCVTVYQGTPMGPGSTCATLAPSILVQPAGWDVCQNTDVTFMVVVCGAPVVHYQWRHDGLPVGADSPTLVLTDVHRVDGGAYDVVVSNAFGNVISVPAVLKVGIRGDSNCDGLVNGQDIDPFVLALFSGRAAWEAQYACDFLCANDMNMDGAVNGLDIDGFVGCLFGSCP